MLPIITHCFVNRNQTTTKPRTSFGSTEAIIRNALNKEIPTSSYFIRGDIPWHSLVKYIDRNFQTPANVRFEACSDGSEIYTFILALLHEKININKFTPIKASDNCHAIIDKTKKGVIGIGKSDAYNFGIYFPKLVTNFRKYFRPIQATAEISRSNNESFIPHEVGSELRQMIEFKQGDILVNTAQSFSEPTIIFARNLIHTLSPHQKEYLAQNLARNLPPKSILALGQVELQPEYAYVNGMFKHVIEKCFSPLKQLKPLHPSMDYYAIFKRNDIPYDL